MMKKLIILAAVMLAVPALADTFGSGDNQFTIEFVPISGDASSANGTNISQFEPGHIDYRQFNDPGYNYRMGKFQITVQQWQSAGFSGGYWTGEQPAASINWFEAAQFVNWLNEFHGYQKAYNFTDGTFNVWDTSDAWDGTNLYRHKDAYYFLPTENEWVKAAYWNGSEIQTWATVDNSEPLKGIDSKYGGYGITAPWNVGSGSEELNGTYDMMGNVMEWMESPDIPYLYFSDSYRGLLGGAYHDQWNTGLRSDDRSRSGPEFEQNYVGFRVASIPEPCTLLLLGVGGIALKVGYTGRVSFFYNSSIS